MYKEGFASKLKQARLERELNQIDVAVALNIPRSTLANYETGRTEPDIETIVKLINFYEIDANWLLSTIGKKEEKKWNL